jgi:DNA-directed RNA polymerase specialized sigma24 family protein
MSLTLAQIQAAQANDLAGIAALLEAMESRINGLANLAALRLPNGSSHIEDLKQDAREALFRALPRVDDGISADRAIGFLYHSMEDALKDNVRATRYQGADKDAVKVFMSMLHGEAEGDAHRAEKLAQTAPPKGVRLSADRAYAARLAWQGAASLDKPISGFGGARDNEVDTMKTLANTLPLYDWDPAVIRPKVGHGAALEALSVLERYAGVTVQRTTPRMFAANLPTLVDVLEGSVVVPREAGARRAVLDAMAILRSAVSTAEEGDLIEELRDVADDRQDERAAKVGMVRAALDSLSEMRRNVIAMSYGIGGARCYGTGAVGDDEALASDLGTGVKNVREARSKGLKSFASKFIALFARNEAEAKSLAAAATVNLGRGGCK